MADGTRPDPPAPLDSVVDGAILFALAGGRYALPLAAVEAIMSPPALCRVPHAPTPLLGAGNLGGQVLPVIDFAEMVPRGRPRRRYEGGGEVMRVNAGGGSVGVWVDRVERFVAGGMAPGEAVTVIDPELLGRAGMAAPSLASDARFPLGEASDLVTRAATEAAETSYFVVETAGERLQLAREIVLEFIERPPWVAVPGAPAGFLGIGIVRDDAFPMLSLASLLDLPETDPPDSFAIVAPPGAGLVLLGFDRVIGLRNQRRQTGRRWVDQTLDALSGAAANGRPVDLAAAISDELRTILAGFSPREGTGRQADAGPIGGARYLVFIAGGETYALSVEAVDRVVPAQRLVALPRCPGANHAIAGAIELRGQLIPVARLEGAAEADEPGAYVILHGASGPMAIGAGRVERLITLHPEQIAPPPGREDLFDGIAVLDGAGDLLRILNPDRVGHGN